MRSVLTALVLGAVLAPCSLAGDLRHFDDAPLHAIQFVDGREGWAVGDEGVVWHTIDGGTTWERQSTGVRASLRSIHFLNLLTGWIAGREELPDGRSVGVLLFTEDAGVKWRPVTLNAFPGLNHIHFVDHKTGFVVGDGSDQYPSGVFATTDTGRNWVPLAGPRANTWLSALFHDAQNGALGGAWNRLAMLREQKVVPKDVDSLGGRGLCGMSLTDKFGVAVGQGGLVLINKDTTRPEDSWYLGDLGLPPEVRAGWDFHAVHCLEHHIWAAGRPGSVLLHSPNRGATWEIVRTRQPLPLNGIFFLNESRGWAVGEMGAILATTDGGKTWQVQRRGGERAALLFVHSRLEGVPLETIAGLGAEEGYLATVLKVVGSDPATAAPSRCVELQRLAAAVRQAGGAAGEVLWQFPLPRHLETCDRADLLRYWDRRHADRAADELRRQLVLALRIWRPEVVITDDRTGPGVSPVEALVAEALRAALYQANDPRVFPEQLQQLGLQPWSAAKLYARSAQRGKDQVVHDATETGPRLQTSPCNFAASAASLLVSTDWRLPGQRFYSLLDSRLEGAAGHRSLMQGIKLALGGEARRDLGPEPELTPEVRKACEKCRNLQSLADQKIVGLVNPNQLLTQVGPTLETLPLDQGAVAAFAVANRFADNGQWVLAREIFLLMLDRYPTHTLSAEACRWLIGHGASSEARRRQELGQFVLVDTVEVQASSRSADKMPGTEGKIPIKPGGKPTGPVSFEVKAPEPIVQVVHKDVEGGLMAQDLITTRRWYDQALTLEPRLTTFGSFFVNDPSTQFCLQAIHRNLGQFDVARRWYGQFASRQPEGPWRDAALAELWLVNHNGPCPKPLAFCRRTDTRPVLDGKLDDPCWRGLKPLLLRSVTAGKGKNEAAPGRTADEDTVDYPTEAYLAYDRHYLYLALRCRHPADRYVPPEKVRQRDADLHSFDRVCLMLDVDRDYTSYFHLQVDQRGCVYEECCQGGHHDATWNPRWFVACHSEREVWQIEAAIPMAELTGEPVTLGKTWACNVVRIVPGRNVQAFSLPAGVKPRPEGMGLLMFTQDDPHGTPAVPNPMPPVP